MESLITLIGRQTETRHRGQKPAGKKAKNRFFTYARLRAKGVQRVSGDHVALYIEQTEQQRNEHEQNYHYSKVIY